MAPLTPHWVQPSHPDIQEVIVNEAEFTSKSLSRVDLPPFALFAKLDFPPCTVADGPTYATVQYGRDKHLDLNSDLLYINHSCEPSLIFDTGNFNVIVGPNGLKAGEELTFFYPSTEWHMAQPFDCLCAKPSCRGRIAGAGQMTRDQLAGTWINGHIRQLLEERDSSNNNNGTSSGAAATAAADNNDSDPTARALRDALRHAEQVVDAARTALLSYAAAAAAASQSQHNSGVGPPTNGVGKAATRRGPTSRELSGEMGGDTVRA
ncbi:uncharacterized protein E0L32_008445 [Thyridium curvatum]|uniref:Post-SET domain-containing protein n=1 Tax=Thyridium curvatum TaxID=1093900 RepID=A0A507AZV2_9PEZI|nr:uncharacterized protein E0L32_008445 [Thyridium curvatum]TPX10559.1 hypothetical protein E0L32_008445 [Thyridium curvatum]